MADNNVNLNELSIPALEKLYNEKAKAYQTKRDEFEKKKEPTNDDKRDCRRQGQELFSYANALRMKRKDLLDRGVADSAADQKRLQALYDNDVKAIKSLSAWLKKYGSPMEGIPSTTFDDIAGLDDVKSTIYDYLFMLKNPAVAKAYKIDTNIGILLYGPPGTGKTMIAEAIANALNVRYFVITPSQIFGSYVGESEQNVRDVFDEMSVCTDGAVLLIDECESIFARRDGNSNRSALGVANQLLQEMNGQGDKASRRVIIGATNRPELMDEAYLRYKRFSLQFYIGMPNNKAKETMVNLKLKGRPYEESFKQALLLRMYGDDLYTCADIAGIIEQCAFLALQECRKNAEQNRQISYGENTPFVKMTPEHLDIVMAKYPRSVTQEMLDGYEEFRNRKITG